jgi:hypothetical protein
MAPFGSHRTIEFMNKPDEQAPGQGAPVPKPTRLEEARRLIEEYANDLRAIIKKLSRYLN